MTWRRMIAGIAVLATLLAAPAKAAPLFPDVPENHWARDAVATLAAKGLVEGYPDGTFKGDRAATRWEVAMIVARLLAKMEQEHATFATKVDLEELRKLVNALREELDALGVRVTNLEESTARLDQRVSELERIRFYGRFHTIGVANNLSGASPFIGTVGNPGIDWSTGRLIIEGSGYSALGLLGLNADISDDIVAGAEFAAFTTQGDLGVDQYWGVSAPWLTNPWTAHGSPIPGVQSDNNIPYTRMVLDNFWVRHKPSETRLTVGSYFSKYLASYVFNGARNPNINQPRWLPLYGADISGTIVNPESGFKYEAFYSLDPDLSLYRTQSMGGVLRYEFPEERGLISMHGVQHRNERINDGVTVGVAGPLIPLPTVPFTGPGAPIVPPGAWLGTPQGAAAPVLNFFVGPQSEFTFGLDASYIVEQEHRIRLFGEFATSSYNPDTSSLAFTTTATGSMYRFGIGARPMERLDLSLDYLRVDPTYDPFIVAYPTPPAIPVFMPYGTYYSAYYQMHDYLEYPNNRQGFRFRGTYTFDDEKTSLYALYGNLRQVAATTPGQVLTAGNIEPLFPMLQGGGSQRGVVENFGAGVSHVFDVGLRTDLAYYRYNINRGATAIDDVDLLQNVWRLDLSYPIMDDLSIRAGYWQMDYSGHTGLLNTSFGQKIPSIGLDFQLARDTAISLDYRFLDFDQRAFAGGDYSGTQLLVEMKVDF